MTSLSSNGNLVSVGWLARAGRVSEMTARRDLALLRDRGLVRMVHGGAVLEVRKAEESTFAATRQEHVEEKRAIAKAAATLVSPRSVVALGAGTTTCDVERTLAEPERPQELARMLGGPSRSGTGLQHALELLEAATRVRQRMKSLPSS